MSHSSSASTGAHRRLVLVTNATIALLIGGALASAGSPSDLRSGQADSPRTAFGNTGMRGSRELVAQRGLYSATYDMGGGQRRSIITIQPQHYQASHGQLLPIDTDVQPTSSQATAFENTTNVLRTEFARTGARVTATAGNVTLRYQPQATRFSDGTWSEPLGAAQGVGARAEGNQVFYDGELPGLDIRYTVRPGRVVQDFILREVPAPPIGLPAASAWFEIGESILFDRGSLTTVNGEIVVHGLETQGALLLHGPGQTIRIGAPFASEPLSSDPLLSEEARSEAVPGSYRVEMGTDGNLMLWSRIPYAWLADPARQYPITIDPTLDIQPDGAVGKDAQLTPNMPANNWGTREFLTDNWGSVDARGVIEFDLSPIPAGSAVSAATLTLWHHYNNEPASIGLHANTSAWNEDTVTWNTMPGHDAIPVDAHVAPLPNVYEDWDVATDIQDFVNGARNNYGWTLRSSTGDMTAYYMASDVGGVNLPEHYPHLVVQYEPGGGGGGGGDEDGDGILDEDDVCWGTVAPEPVPTLRLGINRWALVDDDDVFDTTPPNGVGPRGDFTLADTAGCSCEQIIDALHVGVGHERFGCSIGVMRHWVSLVSP